MNGNLVLTNGKIYLEKEKFAEAMLVLDGKVAAVGTNEEIAAKAPEGVRVYDCKGRTVVPGFNDSHMHLMGRAGAIYEVSLSNIKSIDEMVQRCRTFMAEHPDRCVHGIHATGWNQDLFTDNNRMPDRHDLDRISTEIPIVLERVCGHIVAVNSKAIEMAHLNNDPNQIPGGDVYIGEDGLPNGLLTENATDVVRSLIPGLTMEDYEGLVKDCMEYCVSRGLTSVQSNDVGTMTDDAAETFAFYRDLYARGEGKIRYHHQVCFKDLDEFKDYLEKGEYAHRDELYKGDMLTLGPLKLFKDGSLGAKTALMKNGYVGEPDNHGTLVMTDEEMAAFCKMAAEHGVQVVTHVIGDDAVDRTMDAYEAGFVDGKNALRHCLIHCQITDREILDRIAREDILEGVQPIFLDYDLHVLEERVGAELGHTSYAFGSQYRRGVHLSFGTDCPVEECDPFANIYCAVTRCDKQGWPEGGYAPEEKMDIYDAVDAYTIESAYMQFMEDRKGRLLPGYLADFAVLDRDIFTIDPKEIMDIQVDLTAVDGTVVYER